MPLISYKQFNFREKTLDVIEQSNEILREYGRQGFDLTLRQLYYQFVARGLIPNRQAEYNKLGSIVNDARLAGKIDWHHITDRTRYVRTFPVDESVEDAIRTTAEAYSIDLLEGQEAHVEVWVEKDALVSVVDRACREFTTPYLSCRGYVSQSEMWRAGQRLARKLQDGKRITVLHLGDHDPSGIDMTRDIDQRLGDFVFAHSPEHVDNGNFAEWFNVNRIALTMDQIDQYGPPPNPAKLTDSRSDVYIAEYGDESWELDALEPQVIVDLIEEHLRDLLDEELLEDRRAKEEQEREILTATSERWAEVVEFLTG